MKTERRMDPDYAETEIDSLRRLIAEAIAAKRSEMGVDTYNEFPKAVVKWVAGGILALLISGIGSCIVMYAKLDSLQAVFGAYVTAQREQHDEDLKRIENLERHVYRGGADESSLAR
jgi:hypothetical protein